MVTDYKSTCYMKWFQSLFGYTGTGEQASQKGMNIGGIRYVSDIKADDIAPESQGMLHFQTGL